MDVVPSPKSQDQPVGPPVEVSVNWTVSGALPDVGDAVNDAVGAAGGFVAVVTVSLGAVEAPASRAFTEYDVPVRFTSTRDSVPPAAGIAGVTSTDASTPAVTGPLPP